MSSFLTIPHAHHLIPTLYNISGTKKDQFNKLAFVLYTTFYLTSFLISLISFIIFPSGPLNSCFNYSKAFSSFSVKLLPFITCLSSFYLRKVKTKTN